MRKIILLAITVFLVSSISLYYGYFHTSPNMVFLGGHLPASGEILNMISPQLKQGYILSKNLFTSEWQPRIFLAPSYIPVALLQILLSGKDLIAINSIRVIYIFIFLAVLYKLSFLFFKKSEIWQVLLLTTFTSGFGFLLKFFIPNSIDLWIPEANVFHTLLYSTNFIYNQFFLLLAFYFFIKYELAKNNKHLIFSSLALSLVALEHQFDAITFFLTVFLFLLFVEKNFKIFLKKVIELWPFILPLGILVFQSFLVFHYPNVSAWTKQTNLDSPSVLAFISGFGIMGIFAGYFIAKNEWKKLSIPYQIIIFWLISVLLLIYSPIPFQRRFTEGVFIPICLLGFVPFLKWWKNIKKKIIIYPIVITLLVGSNVFLLYQDYQAFNIDPKQSPFYIYKADEKGLKWLEVNSTERDVILSDAIYSPLIPG